MGDRGQVLIKDEGVYLYTHWNATELEDTVRMALRRGGDRWDDPEYLARIIFCEMTEHSTMETSGYGIGTSEHGDIWLLITVDCARSTITVKDSGEVVKTESFKKFIE